MARFFLCVAVVGAAVLAAAPLRNALLVNRANVLLMHAAMDGLGPQVLTADVAPSLHDPRVGRAAALFAAAYGRAAIRGAARTALVSGHPRDAARFAGDLFAHGTNFDRMFAGALASYAGDRHAGVAMWIDASRVAGLLEPLAIALSEQVPNDVSPSARAAAAEAANALRAAEQKALPNRRPFLARRIALAYLQVDDVAAAEDALRNNSSAADPAVQAELAAVLVREGRVDEAERRARGALAVDPSHELWLPHYVLASIALKRCDVDAAIHEAREGLALPYDGDYRYYDQMRVMGEAEYEKGNVDTAMSLLRRYLAVQPLDQSVPPLLEQVAGHTLPRRCGGGRRS